LLGLLYLCFAALLRLPHHKAIADAVLGLAVLHSMAYFIAEPASLRYLLPTAPAYMLAGVAAVLAMAILAATSSQTLRRKLARSRFGFRGQHIFLSALLLMLAPLHVLGALLVPVAATPSRPVMISQQERLPVFFPHETHDGVPCVTCHHKVVGMKQTLPCVACHRLPDPAIKLSAEPRFHSFCRDCHADKSRDGQTHGPVRDCNGCHRAQS
jgi:Class III cytochrome C family/Ferric reductase like transmembrane component